MNIYTRRRGTQEAAVAAATAEGSKSGGGGQSEHRCASSKRREEADGALLSPRSTAVSLVVSTGHGVAATRETSSSPRALVVCTSTSLPDGGPLRVVLKLEQRLKVARYFLEIISVVIASRASPHRRN